MVTREQLNSQRDAAIANLSRQFNETVERERGRKTKERFFLEPRGRMLLAQLGRAINNQKIIAQRKISGIGADFEEGFQRKPEGTRPIGGPVVITDPRQTSAPINPFTNNTIIKLKESLGIRVTKVEPLG